MLPAEYLVVPGWPAPPNVKTLQTIRQGGVSAAPYDSLNLGAHVGDNPLAVAHNRELLNHLLPGEPLWLEQVHGTGVANADMAGCGCDTLLTKLAVCGSSRMVAPDETTSHSTWLSEDDGQVVGYPAPDGFTAPSRGDMVRADACIARHRGSVCVVMTADCLPVLLCDAQGAVVGAAHAGWRGLCDGVIEATARAMQVAPQNLMAWLGPAIGQEHFEVGDEVRAAFVAVQPQAASAFIPGQPGKWFADIYALARMRLEALGIVQIYGGGRCTYREHEKFFSYRRDGVTGRMGTFIWLT